MLFTQRHAQERSSVIQNSQQLETQMFINYRMNKWRHFIHVKPPSHDFYNYYYIRARLNLTDSPKRTLEIKHTVCFHLYEFQKSAKRINSEKDNLWWVQMGGKEEPAGRLDSLCIWAVSTVYPPANITDLYN